jgi:biofilm PGA synthesis N-glycosyltransferase PgaC
MEWISEIRSIDWLLLSLGVVQMLYMLVFFIRLYTHKPKTRTPQTEGVSLIIATRNQADLLKENLPHWLNQDYPKYELIVVNDGSWDATLDILKAFDQGEDRLKIVDLNIDERFHKGKKFAITMGIKAATYDWLLFTDTDCVPASVNWISEMMSQRSDKTEIVLGYSPYLRKKSLINLFIQYETFLTAQQYLSFALSGLPYMGVGRNLLYKKELFFRVKGFASHQHILSGDDDLFVNETSTKHNTAVAFSEDALIYSEPKETFTDWFKQKTRHLSTAKHYKAKHQLLLGLWAITHFLFYGFFIASLLISPQLWHLPVIIFGSKLLIQLMVYGLNMKKLNKLFLLPYLLFLDVGMLIYSITIGLEGFFAKPKTWNG